MKRAPCRPSTVFSSVHLGGMVFRCPSPTPTSSFSIFLDTSSIFRVFRPLSLRECCGRLVLRLVFKKLYPDPWRLEYHWYCILYCTGYR